MSKITPRILALATVASVATVAAISGAFAAWYPTSQSSMTCTHLTTDKYGYGYGYNGAVGYGYDCTTTSSSTSNSSGGGGGGGSSYSSSSTTSTGTTSAVKPTVVIFSDFVKKCESVIKDLTDSRLTAFYNEINVINQSNINRALTRAEFLKLVLNAAKVDVTKEAVPAYSDIDASHTLYQYVAYATRIGMVSGQDGKFRPNDTITRAEAAKIFVNAAGLTLSTEIKTFSDVSASNSLAAYIQTAFDNCLLHGRKTQGGESTVAERVYEPNSNITLAETAKVLYNIVK